MCSIIVGTVLLHLQSYCVTPISNIQSYLEKSILKPNKKFDITSHMVIQGKRKSCRRIKISRYIFFSVKLQFKVNMPLPVNEKCIKIFFVKKYAYTLSKFLFSLVKLGCYHFFNCKFNNH